MMPILVAVRPRTRPGVLGRLLQVQRHKVEAHDQMSRVATTVRVQLGDVL